MSQDSENNIRNYLLEQKIKNINFKINSLQRKINYVKMLIQRRRPRKLRGIGTQTGNRKKDLENSK